DQHVDVGDDVVAVPLDQALCGSLDHVDRGFVRPDGMAKLGRAEHQVGRQVVRAGELRVGVGVDGFAGQVGGNVGQANGGLVHDVLIQSGVTESPLRWRYSAI